MSTYNEMQYCAACEKPTLHLRHGTSHILHLLLSVLTFGAWLVVWLGVALSNAMRSQCTVCGRTHNWGPDEAPRAKIVARHTPREQKTMEELLRDGD